MSNEFHRDSIDAVVSRLETVAGQMEKQLAEGKATFAEHEKRIRKLEAWRIYVIGLSAGAGLVIRAGWEWLTNHGGKH
jgi:hypothetical protein